MVPGLILGLHPANERRRYKVTPSLTGWEKKLESALGTVMLPPWITSIIRTTGVSHCFDTK